MDESMKWLRAQLDTDERHIGRARLVLAKVRDRQQEVSEDVRDAVLYAYGEAGYDPDRALRHVQAHRAILAEHRDQDGECYACSDKRGDSCEPSPCATVRLLASIYSDRDGYRAEWSA